MAKVPDLGSDFAQKLLRDLRRRRERLGFESPPAPAQAQCGTTNAAAPRGKFCMLAGVLAVSVFALHWHCVLRPSFLCFFSFFGKVAVTGSVCLLLLQCLQSVPIFDASY
jgi:hypothetical protein